MAGPVARHLQGGPHAPVGIQQGRSMGVAVGVDPDDDVNLALEHGHGRLLLPDGDRCLARPGLASPRGGRTVRGHARRRTGFSIRPATMVGQAGAGSSRTDQPQGTPPGGQRGLGSLSLPAPACQHPDQAPPTASQRGLLRARGPRGRTAGPPRSTSTSASDGRSHPGGGRPAMAEVDPDQEAALRRLRPAFDPCHDRQGRRPRGRPRR
jgi:hypothetical protein